MENKKNIKNKMFQENNSYVVRKKGMIFSAFFDKIGFLTPLIIFLSFAYFLGFSKWGLFYEKDILTLVLFGALSLIFSIFLMGKDYSLINGFLVKVRDRKIMILFSLNCLFIFISIFFSTYKYVSMLYVFKFFLVILFFVFGMLFSISENFKKIFFKFYNLLSWILAIWVLLGSFYITYFSEMNTTPNAIVRFLSSFSQGGLNRNLLGSIFGYPNTLASFLGCFIFVTIFFLLKEKNINQKFVQLLKLVIFIVGFLLTQSRASFLLLVLCVGIFGFLLLFSSGGKNRKISFVVLLLLIIFLSAFFFVPSREAISSILFPKTLQINGEYSIQDRINLIKDGLKYFSKNFIFGTGLDTYKYNFYLYRTKLSSNVVTTDPHSFLINELGEAGIIGTLLFLSFLGCVFLKIFKKIKAKDKAYLSLIFAIIFGILHAFMDWDWLFLLSLLNLALLFGFSYGNSFDFLAEKEDFKKNRPLSIKIVFVISTLIILVSSCLLVARVNFEKARASNGDVSYFAYKLIPFNLDYAMLKAKISSLSGEDLFLTEKYFEESTRIVPRYFLPWGDYTNYLLSLKDEKALGTALKLVALSPCNSSNNYLLAKVYYSFRNYEKAKEFSKKAIILNPMDINSKLLFGESEMALGNIKEAIEILTSVYKKDIGNEGVVAALLKAYEQLKNEEKQLNFIGKVLSGGEFEDNANILQILKKTIPIITFSGTEKNRQFQINENEPLDLNWTIEGKNIEKASGVSLSFRNLLTKQEFLIGEFDIGEKNYKFVLTPGNYQIIATLFAKNTEYFRVTGEDRFNKDTITVVVEGENSSAISEGNALLLKATALENLKVTSYYFPAKYVLSKLADNKIDSYNNLVQAFNDQWTKIGDKNVYGALNSFIKFSPFKGIKEKSIQAYEPVTVVFEKEELDTKLFNWVDFFATGEGLDSYFLGRVFIENIKKDEYQAFLRTGDLKPGEYKIYAHLNNYFIANNKLSAPAISFNLEIRNEKLQIQNIEEYLKIIETRILEKDTDMSYLSYLKGVLEYNQGKYTEAAINLRKGVSYITTLVGAKEKYLSLFPKIKNQNVVIKNVVGGTIYSDTPFIASWEILDESFLVWTKDIYFILINEASGKYYQFAKGEVIQKNIVVFDFAEKIPEGKYQLGFDYFGEEGGGEYSKKDSFVLTQTKYSVILSKTKMPLNLAPEKYSEAVNYYKESPEPNYDLVYWLGSLALTKKDYKMITYYFNICTFGGNRAEYCGKILKEMNLPNIYQPWAGYNAGLINETYMPLMVGFVEKTKDSKLLPDGYKIEILEEKNLKVLKTFETSKYSIWEDNTIFTSIFLDLPESGYYLRITIDKIKDGRNLKIVSYTWVTILNRKPFEYTKEDLDYFEYMAISNPEVPVTNCILARVNFYKNNFDEAIKYMLAAQKQGYENCLNLENLTAVLKGEKNTKYGEIDLKNNNFMLIGETNNKQYKFLDLMARNNVKEDWDYLSYKKENNKFLLLDNEKNKKFDNNSEYAILVLDEGGNLIFLPTSRPIKK